MVCGEGSILEIDERGYRDWQAGELIQVAFPEMTYEDREVLISGTHPVCFDRIFPE